MLNRIPVSKGGAEGSITGRVISGVCSDALFSAIRKFEDANFPGRRRGFVDPDSAMLRLMEALSADKPAPVPPPAKPSPPPSAKKTIFTPGVMHNHQPTGRWTEVQNDPKSQFGLNTIARHGDPAAVMLAAGLAAMRDKPLAIKHLNWFVNEGNGRDFVEDKNLDLMLRTDAKVQAKIRSQLPKVQTSGVFAGHLAITQDDYEDEDFQYSFGEIDRLDFEADFSEGTFHAWFMDRYEWHPYYPSIYKVMDGDYLRPTNAVHAAAVEMKAGSARDFWMIGEVRIPLKAIQSAADKSDTVWVDPKPWY